MAKHVFTPTQRWAVFKVHGEKCYLCDRPINLQSFHVDHVIPEFLIDRPDELAKVVGSFGLHPTFDLNSYENWMPACPRCNNRKGASIFEPTPLIQVVLQKAKKKAIEARRIERREVTNAQLARALNIVERATSARDFNPDLLRPLLLAYAQNRPELLKSLRREDSSIRDDYYVSAPIATLRVTPFYSVVFEDESYRLIETPYRVGYEPT